MQAYVGKAEIPSDDLLDGNGAVLSISDKTQLIDAIIAIGDKMANQGMHQLSAVDFQRLFRSESTPGAPLTLKDFKSDVIDARIRRPLVWPGNRVSKSFWDHMDDAQWRAFSLKQLENTVEYIQEIQGIVGSKVPASALPFLMLPRVKELIRLQTTSRSMTQVDAMNAVDMLRGLRSCMLHQGGSTRPSSVMPASV